MIDIEHTRVFEDGNTWCIVQANFIDLQSSPAVFVDKDSEEGRILTLWQQSPCPLRHLPWVWLFPILERLEARGE